MDFGSIISGLVSPVTKLLTKRTERKAAREAIAGKLAEAKITGANEVTFAEQELEGIARMEGKNSWKDEYATVSVLSILNLIVLGGIAGAFGYPQVVEGMKGALLILTTLGVDIGFLIEAVVGAAVGFSLYKKFSG